MNGRKPDDGEMRVESKKQMEERIKKKYAWIK